MTPEYNYLMTGYNYTIAANTRCQYRVFISRMFENSTSKLQYSGYLNSHNANVSLYVRRTGMWTSTTQNYQLTDFNVANAVYNGSYILVINQGNTPLTFGMKFHT